MPFSPSFEAQQFRSSSPDDPPDVFPPGDQREHRPRRTHLRHPLSSLNAPDEPMDDEDDEDPIALGFAAYNDSDQPLPNVTDHEAMAVPPTFADTFDSVSQEEIDNSIYRLAAGGPASRELYDSQRMSQVRLSDLRRWYETKNAQAAMGSLLFKKALHIDPIYLVAPDDPDIVIGRREVRLDYKLIVGLERGLDPALPNLRAPGVEEDPTWRFFLRPDRRHYDYRGDRKPIGIDPQGRMVYFGQTRSAEDVWLLVAPRESVGRTPMSDLTFSEGSTRMSSKDVRVAMALLAWMLEKINYGAIVVPPPYPNIESDAAFYESADIL
ncbi:hypothetical protein BV20DRAFT_1058511 [Pilatotrama ljubarskyi]|nr:hypothetical protein BV20DRAFT_1058511 [Pilatotrama ljubarskyi]